jgi:hypothetical protein
MCEKCEAIDAKTAYYRQLRAKVDDETAIALLDLVIGDLEADKARLHSEDKTA